jgi:hypothetical protein
MFIFLCQTFIIISKLHQSNMNQSKFINKYYQVNFRMCIFISSLIFIPFILLSFVVFCVNSGVRFGTEDQSGDEDA